MGPFFAFEPIAPGQDFKRKARRRSDAALHNKSSSKAN
jgi:hypothetical protein